MLKGFKKFISQGNVIDLVMSHDFWQCQML